MNKIATLRNSRGKNLPDVLKVSLDIERFGAEGITVHPRPDGRHIRKEDVDALKANIKVELNVEGYPSDDFLTMVENVVPAQATLVPDPPHVLTSNAGWRVTENEALLAEVVERLRAKGIRVSVFIDPRTVGENDWRLLRKLGVDRVELYTEEYADAFSTPRRDEVTALYRSAAEQAQAHGLGVNAGHDLNLINLRHLVTAIPWIDEVSIGHALISDALYDGLEKTVARYLSCLR
ncbi:MAG: pyridoxine 5'-phosphate synthase [Bdellovibrionaceae bacterium]|nr:pyridoxine 5'-phosphate synthase [Pseudobdellovibrionaceae bacterium]